MSVNANARSPVVKQSLVSLITVGSSPNGPGMVVKRLRDGRSTKAARVQMGPSNSFGYVGTGKGVDRGRRAPYGSVVSARVVGPAARRMAYARSRPSSC
jgi:hypothetical protein